MPASRHTMFLLAGTALAGVMLATPAAWAQDRGRPLGQSQTLTSGRTGASGTRGVSAPQAGSETGGLLRPGLAPAADADGAVTTATASRTTGSVDRPGLRPPKSRRSAAPAQAPIKGDFRPTIAPPGIAVDVQPVQTGVPNLPLPLPPLRRRPAFDDPYAPLGVRVGNVVLTPTIGQYFGYDTNPNRLQTNRQPSAMSQTEVELGIQSDWSRHDLYGQLRGAYSEYFDNPAARRPEGAGNLRLRVDVTRDTEFDIEGHYLIDTQRPSSPDLNANVVARPVIYTEGASAGLTHRFNRLIASIRSTIDRSDFEDARLPGGVILDQSDRAFTQYGLRGRLGYEIHPGLIPFFETFVDTRQYDRKIDNAGFERSSDGIALRGGALIELTRLLTTEVSAGAVTRTYEDKRLGTLTSPVADLSLIYTLTPLTTIRATASAAVDETAVPGARGIRSLRGVLEIQHALRRNLTLSAGLRASDAVYQGIAIEEKGIGAFVRADWRLNRSVALRASYSWDQIRSTVRTSSYDAHTVLLGLRLTP